jgi:hypothetical protein
MLRVFSPCSLRGLPVTLRCRRSLLIGRTSVNACGRSYNRWQEVSQQEHFYSKESYWNRFVPPNRGVIDRQAKMSFSSTSDDQASAIQLIERVHNRRVPPELVAQKVQEVLLKLVTNDQNIGRKHDEGPLALDLLNIVLRYKIEKTNLMPRLCSLSMQVMKRSGHPLAPMEVYRVMWMLLDNHPKWFSKDVLVNTKHVNDCFCQVIRSLLDADDIGNRKKARLDYDTTRRLDELVNFMQRLWEDPSIRLVANSEATHAMILYLCKQQKAAQAYQLLQWTAKEEERTKHPVSLTPHASSFTTLISTFGKLGEPETAESIVQWMLACSQKSRASSTGTAFPPPNRTCMNALLDGWARSGRDDAGVKAETVLEWMEQLHNGPDALDTKPDEISYSICANAWAHSKPDRNSAIRAEAILRRMIDLHELGSGGIGPVPEPAFTSVMNAWGRSKADDAPERVMSLLKLTQEFSKASNQSFSMPEVGYTILITAWQNYASQQAPHTVTKLLCGDKILQVLTAMEMVGVKANAPTHNATIMALLEVSPTNAMLYFLEVEEKFRNGQAHIDTRTFNCGLNVIATSNKPDGAEQAMAVLERMVGYSQQQGHTSKTGVRPDMYTYNISLKILSRSSSNDAARKANQLLEEMERSPHVKPSYISYVTCIIAWGRSEDPNKFDRVQDVLASFVTTYNKRELSGRLTVTPYNASLAVCHHNKSPELQSKALQTAIEVMSSLRQLRDVRPDETTYANLFRAVMVNSSSSNSDGDDHVERDKLLGEALEHCISDGLVSAEIVKIVFQISQSTFGRFFGENQTPVTVIVPKSWATRVGQLRRKEPEHASGALL